MRKPIFAAIALLLGSLLTFGVCLLSVSKAVCSVTQERILDADAAKAGEYDVVLVLGCRVYEDGRMSHMLEDRVSVGISLLQSGVSDRILMSGDGFDPAIYDEVSAMREAALAAGVPADAIQTDPMGLSTYDSLARLAKEQPGARVLIVTQEYHLYRALYLADKLGLKAYGVGADPRTYTGQFKREVREVLARCKDVWYGLVQPTPAGM